MDENNPWKEWKLMIYVAEEYFSNQDVYFDTLQQMKNNYDKVIEYLDNTITDDVIRTYKKNYVYDNLIFRLGSNPKNANFIQDIIDLSDKNNLSSPGIFLDGLLTKQEKDYTKINNEYRQFSPELVQERVNLIFELFTLHTDVISGIDSKKQPSNLKFIKKGLMIKELIAKFKGLIMALNNSQLFEPYINVLENEVKNINQIVVPSGPLNVLPYNPEKPLRSGTCFNILTGNSDDFIEFLQKDDNNIVVAYNGNIECNTRDNVLYDIQKEIVGYSLYNMRLNEDAVNILQNPDFSLFSFENTGSGFYKIRAYMVDEYINL
jgi:hypothetical protein